MIKIDLAQAFCFFMVVPVVFFLGMWVVLFFKDKDRRDDPASTEMMRQCPYCGRIFMEHQQKKISVCPVCKSYVEEGAR